MFTQNNLRRRILAIALLFSFALAATLVAQEYKPLLGKWNMTSETDGDSLSWALELKETDGQMAGVISANGNEMPAKNFSYTGGVIKFVVPYDGDEYQIELKSDGENKLTGTWSGNGNSGRTRGTKQ